MWLFIIVPIYCFIYFSFQSVVFLSVNISACIWLFIIKQLEVCTFLVPCCANSCNRRILQLTPTRSNLLFVRILKHYSFLTNYTSSLVTVNIGYGNDMLSDDTLGLSIIILHTIQLWPAYWIWIHLLCSDYHYYSLLGINCIIYAWYIQMSMITIGAHRPNIYTGVEYNRRII